MPRIKFRMAADGDQADVNCVCFRHEPGKAPDCSALTHPWCLAAGSGGPEKCKFQKEKEVPVYVPAEVPEEVPPDGQE